MMKNPRIVSVTSAKAHVVPGNAGYKDHKLKLAVKAGRSNKNGSVTLGGRRSG